MIENYIRNMPEEELSKILKDSGVKIISNGIIELEEEESFGSSTKYKKTISIKKYIEQLIDESNRSRVRNKLEEKFKLSILEVRRKVGK